jgi:ADP-ribosylglycohydrolase
LAIHGTGHRLHKWVEETTKLTHTDPQAVDSCRVLATLAEHGVSHQEQFNASKALNEATEVSSDQALQSHLRQLASYLDASRSPSAVARHFGWDTGIEDHVLPITVMATYCWLRYPKKFRRAVESAICLGGASAALGCVTGSLAGAHVGQARISRRLRKRLNSRPHDPKWIEQMAERFSHWPHGAEDLHVAPAQSSDPFMQIVRNMVILPWSVGHWVYRVPYQGSPRRVPRRSR